MASHVQSWFDDEKLFPGERIMRAGRAWYRTGAAPKWWEGELILTTDRLFFLPNVDNRTIDRVAFWLTDVSSAREAGRNCLRIVAGSEEATFEAHDGSSAALMALRGHRQQPWLDAIASLRPAARPYSVLAGEPRRRAAG